MGGRTVLELRGLGWNHWHGRKLDWSQPQSEWEEMKMVWTVLEVKL